MTPQDSTLRLPPGYALREDEPDFLVLLRGDGSIVGMFSFPVTGAGLESIQRVAEDDYQNKGERGTMIFLTAPKDLQQSPAYERALALLGERHGEGAITADRELFDSIKQWRKGWKEVYGKAQLLYVLARHDATVGLGIYKQCRYMQRNNIPMVLMFADEQGSLAGSGEHEEFGLEKLNTKGSSEQDLGRFALVKP